MTSTLWQVHFQCPAQWAEVFAEAYEDEVAAVSWLGQDTDQDWTIELIYEGEPDLYHIQKTLQSLENQHGIETQDFRAEPVPQKDWVKESYQQFPPLKLGRFYVYGSHVEEAPPQDMHAILVDAATAFGSGQHGTTAGCLLILDQIAPENPRAVLDMGCGSGILAMAMASLWTGKVLACDNDPEAVRVTQENAQLNNLTLVAFSSEGFLSPILSENGPFDVITANILAGPLIEMAPQMRQHTALGGKIVLSGLLITQAPQVLAAYQDQGFVLLEEKPLNEWMTLLMERVR